MSSSRAATTCILRTTLRAGFSDAQCGFKALRADVARELLPLVEDQGWFFDTELLVLAEHNGLRIHEVPVDWVDDPVSRVDIVRTATDDLRGVWRMLRRFARSATATLHRRHRDDPTTVDPRLGPQVVRFASIGVVSTVVFAALFALLDGPLGPGGCRRGRAARVRVREHRREPPPHVRAARPRRSGPPLRRRHRARACSRSR